MDLPTEVAIKSTASVDLNKHANQKVEITGTLDDDYASSARVTPAPGSGSATGRSGSGSGADRDRETPTMTIASIRMVSPSCN